MASVGKILGSKFSDMVELVELLGFDEDEVGDEYGGYDEHNGETYGETYRKRECGEGDGETGTLSCVDDTLKLVMGVLGLEIWVHGTFPVIAVAAS